MKRAMLFIFLLTLIIPIQLIYEAQVVESEAKLLTSLSLQSSPNPAQTTDLVAIKGQLAAAGQPLANQKVQAEFSTDTKRWAGIAAATTDSEGRFSANWKPISEGQFYLRAAFAGDRKYRSSSSNVILQQVNDPTATPTPASDYQEFYDYQDNILLEIDGIDVFIDKFDKGFPPPHSPYTDRFYMTNDGIVFNGTYAAISHEPSPAVWGTSKGPSTGIYSSTKVLVVNAKNLTSFLNFFWVIGHDLDKDHFGLGVSSTGKARYLWDGGSYPVGSVDRFKVRFIITTAYYNGSSSSYWGRAAVIYENGTCAVFNPTELPYQPSFTKYRAYADRMSGNFLIKSVVLTNATIEEFYTKVFPYLDKIQINRIKPDLNNIMDEKISKAETGWVGHSGLTYWGYDRSSYRSPPSAGRLNWTDETTDLAVWTRRLDLPKLGSWAYFATWIHMSGMGFARIGVDFRNSSGVIIKEVSSYYALTFMKWVYVEVWAYAPEQAVSATPWIQFWKGNRGDYVLFDDAVVSFTDSPLLKFDARIDADVQVKLERVLLGKDWFSIEQ